jgi:ElaB/YqjD/DUF883 family membrane-anchored ribosome-binding protein
LTGRSADFIIRADTPLHLFQSCVLLRSERLQDTNDQRILMDKEKQSSTEQLEQAGNGTLRSLREAGEEIQNRLEDFWETSKEQAASCARATDRTIRDKPWQSVGIAFGVGLLFGLLISAGGRRSYED